jgi:hypothetical protein
MLTYFFLAYAFSSNVLVLVISGIRNKFIPDPDPGGKKAPDPPDPQHRGRGQIVFLTKKP